MGDYRERGRTVTKVNDEKDMIIEKVLLLLLLLRLLRLVKD